MRGRQSAKKGTWCIGGKKRRYRKERGKGFPVGLIASAAAQFLGEVAKPILKKILAVKEEEDEDEEK